ncbi:GNAT family N-acetyltransferase [Herpetosiphon sp. NSE202]|uniref:GNAT family N-acetyltransferase n=1 Tax=Herpetosiphon sp. NSE202 TaxID=3351349 RepID=UPI0036341C9F
MQIQGQRCMLRDWQLNDLALWGDWLRPEHEWQRWDGPYYPGPTLAEIPELVAQKRAIIEAAEWPNPRMNLVIADPATDQLLGTVTSYWESIETNWLCLGIAIYDPAWWQRGIGREAFGLWIDYQFAQRPELVRLDLRTWSGNQRMVKLATTLGFRQEACFRKARIVEGHYYDGLGFGILREEWHDFIKSM